MDDRHELLGVLALALNDGLVAISIAKLGVTLESVGRGGFPASPQARTKSPNSRAVASGRMASRAAPAAKPLPLMPLPDPTGHFSTAITNRLLFGLESPRPRLSGLPRPP